MSVVVSCEHPVHSLTHLFQFILSLAVFPQGGGAAGGAGARRRRHRRAGNRPGPVGAGRGARARPAARRGGAARAQLAHWAPRPAAAAQAAGTGGDQDPKPAAPHRRQASGNGTMRLFDAFSCVPIILNERTTPTRCTSFTLFIFPFLPFDPCARPRFQQNTPLRCLGWEAAPAPARVERSLRAAEAGQRCHSHQHGAIAGCAPDSGQEARGASREAKERRHQDTVPGSAART